MSFAISAYFLNLRGPPTRWKTRRVATKTLQKANTRHSLFKILKPRSQQQSRRNSQILRESTNVNVWSIYWLVVRNQGKNKQKPILQIQPYRICSKSQRKHNQKKHVLKNHQINPSETQSENLLLWIAPTLTNKKKQRRQWPQPQKQKQHKQKVRNTSPSYCFQAKSSRFLQS